MFGKKIKKEVNIEGMHCQNCANRVENALKEIDGVKKVNVLLNDKKAIIISNKEIDDNLIKTKIEDLGYKYLN